jgi:hypothetical protein
MMALTRQNIYSLASKMSGLTIPHSHKILALRQSRDGGRQISTEDSYILKPVRYSMKVKNFIYTSTDP